MSKQISTGSKDPLHELDGLYTGDTIRTFKGHYLNVFDPKPESIDIEDIAHALSHVCRFAGHTRIFYSVAQHSIEVMKMCSRENRLAGLLHDASEAYMCDLPRPIKRNLPEYKNIEENLMGVIAQKFGLEYPFHPEIKKADEYQLHIEYCFLMNTEASKNQKRLDYMTFLDAKKLFLELFETLH